MPAGLCKTSGFLPHLSQFAWTTCVWRQLFVESMVGPLPFCANLFALDNRTEMDANCYGFLGSTLV